MDHNLANFYRTRLSVYPAEHVVLNIQQVISVIGVEKTEELAEYVSAVVTDKYSNKRMKSRSLIPASKRFSREGLARFKRTDLLAAINEAEQAEVYRRIVKDPS